MVTEVSRLIAVARDAGSFTQGWGRHHTMTVYNCWLCDISPVSGNSVVNKSLGPARRGSRGMAADTANSQASLLWNVDHVLCISFVVQTSCI